MQVGRKTEKPCSLHSANWWWREWWVRQDGNGSVSYHHRCGQWERLKVTETDCRWIKWLTKHPSSLKLLNAKTTTANPHFTITDYILTISLVTDFDPPQLCLLWEVLMHCSRNATGKPATPLQPGRAPRTTVLPTFTVTLNISMTNFIREKKGIYTWQRINESVTKMVTPAKWL